MDDNKRYTELAKSVPSTLKMQLDNIKRYLYFTRDGQVGGHASLMVGAGFSKNADKGIDATMLDWNELGKKFYETLYGMRPTDKNLANTSPIRLASMVEAALGRAFLDNLIEKALPDERMYPNDLYTKLLSLPWKDVFTTNYDRLLERGAITKGTRRHYNIVTNKETLIYTSSPRIIKLHGSFPDIHPYIITEEDYRTYPAKYPEFVNTVRQSLIENLFCLIGFSGDDPNFLNWTGWMRDVMGRLSLPVYLITYEKHVHDAQVKLLANRNIQLVNLATIPEIDSYGQAFDFLFHYLSKQEESNRWDCSLSYDLDSDDKINAFIEKSAMIRGSYPQWIVLPEQYYDYFDNDLNSNNIRKCLECLKDVSRRIDFLFEIDWRLYVSLTPRGWDWYQTELESIKISPDDSLQTKQKILWLKVSLLTVYRHSSNNEDYRKLQEFLHGCVADMPNDVRTRYYNEVALCYLADLKYEKVLQVTQVWKPAMMDYKARILRATLLYECGECDKVVSDLHQMVEDINLQKISADSSLLPYYDSCLQIICSHLYIYDTLLFYKKKLSNDIDIVSYDKFLNKLKENKKKEFTISHGFGISSYTTHWNIGNGEYYSDYLNSYRALTWLEETGTPLGLCNMGLEEKNRILTISSIIGYEPEYAVKQLVRTCNSNVIEEVLSRDTLLHISRCVADRIFDLYLPYVCNIQKEDNGSRKVHERKCLKLFARLSCKASEEHVVDTVKLLIENRRGAIFDFKVNEFDTCFQCLSRTGIEQILVPVYTMPWYEKEQTRINLPKLEEKNFEIEDKIVEFIKNGFSNDAIIANQAFERIVCLYSCLSDAQKQELTTIVINWRNSSKKMTPEMLDSYHYFGYESSENVDIKTIVCQQIDELNIDSYKTDGKSSLQVSAFDNRIKRLLPVINYADDAYKKKLLEKLCHYLHDNFEVLKKDDSKEIMGGLRSFAKNLLRNICGLLRNGGINTFSKEDILPIYKILKQYAAKGFYIYYTLSLLAKEIGCIEEVKEMISSHLFTSSIVGVGDYLNALYQVMTVSFDSILMNKIVDYIEFACSADVKFYVDFINTAIRERICPSDHLAELNASVKAPLLNTNQLTGLLDSLYGKVNSIEDGNIVADIEYSTIRLVYTLIQKDPYWGDNEAVKKWISINKSEDTFNDVRYCQ